MLKNRVALITGSSRGIGAATAKLFGEQHASVAVNYSSNKAAAEAVVSEIVSKGGKAIAVQADVTNCQQVKSMIDTVTNQLGPIDTLVLNAGMNFKFAPFLEQSWEDIEKKIMGEMKAVFYACQYLLPQMVERQKGCIICVSSGLSKKPGKGFVAHSAAKAAMNLIAHSLAGEFGQYGIRINTVAPGLTLTDATSWMPEERMQMAAKINPMKRIGQPEDLAGAILLLASDYARYINGGYLPVDGGLTML
ncbi:MAG: SDR family NAD(P)-dependent oxidoreductase [Bacillota bacterium]